MSRGDYSEYWTNVGKRWDSAEKAAENERPKRAFIRKSVFSSFLTRVLGSQMPIVITGERGAGKTELYRALTGDLASRREGMSAGREDLRAALHTGSQKIRSTFVVVPGQDSDPHGGMLQELFSSTRAPSGVIHVVSARYDRIWGAREVSVVEDALSNEQAMRKAEIENLSATDGKLSSSFADLDRLATLKELQAKSLMWHLREHNKRQELQRFRLLCRDCLRPAWGRPAAGRRPTWLIIAVTKFDLWHDDRESVKGYYVPGQQEDESAFCGELRDLVSDLGGAATLERLAVLPVASYPQPYALSTSFEKNATLSESETDSLVNHFRNVVGEFCDTRKK